MGPLTEFTSKLRAIVYSETVSSTEGVKLNIFLNAASKAAQPEFALLS